MPYGINKPQWHAEIGPFHGKQCQYNTCCCPGSLSHQAISRYEIHWVQLAYSCLPWELFILAIYIIPMSRNNVTYKHFFTFLQTIRLNMQDYRMQRLNLFSSPSTLTFEALSRRCLNFHTLFSKWAPSTCQSRQFSRGYLLWLTQLRHMLGKQRVMPMYWLRWHKPVG